MLVHLSLTRKVQGHTYAIEVNGESVYYLVPEKVVTLTSTNPDLPLPNPEYFKLHRACARVLHLSGAAEYIDDVIQREELLKETSEGQELNAVSYEYLYEKLAALSTYEGDV